MNSETSFLYLVDGQPMAIVSPPDSNARVVYEVIRVIDGVCLFLEDHLERMQQSLWLLQLPLIEPIALLADDIRLLQKLTKQPIANIRIELILTGNSIERRCFYIPHQYPAPDMYRKGAVLASLNAERPNPAAKVVHPLLKQAIDERLQQTGAYEVVLVNSQGLITEGSRSNLLFVKNNCVYTAPLNMVLTGVTLKYVLKACKNASYNVVFEPIAYNDLNQVEAAAMIGTSPKVLGIQKIDEFEFTPMHEMVMNIAMHYHDILDQYIYKNKR